MPERFQEKLIIVIEGCPECEGYHVWVHSGLTLENAEFLNDYAHSTIEGAMKTFSEYVQAAVYALEDAAQEDNK